MSTSVMQHSFHSGEWAPSLNARVDLAKYRAAAALLRNFYVDYRGGVSTCPGTKYILQAKASATPVRLIPFQASFTVNYVLEFGDLYIRFYNNGAPVLESATTITAITKANPGVVTSNGHGYSNGDWVYLEIAGMTQLNQKYFIVANKTANTYELTDLHGTAINTTSYSTFTSGTAKRVYTLTTTYAAADLAQLKFAQNINTLVICHPNYAPRVLTLTTATSWSIAAITFGPTLSAPTGQSVATTLGAGSANYAYQVTAVDANGIESAPSAFATLASKLDLRTNAGTNTVSWSAVTGAVSYNIYKAQLSYAGALPSGTMLGYIGNATGLSFVDSNISPDFSVTPRITNNPFSGSGVSSITITSAGVGAYTVTPTVSFSGGGGSGAAGQAVMLFSTFNTIASAGAGYAVNDILTLDLCGARVLVTSVNGSGGVTGASLLSVGNPTYTIAATLQATGGSGSNAAFGDCRWGVNSINISNPGSGYGTPPTISFSSGTATATATIGAASAGNPTVPAYFDQRLVLASQAQAPNAFHMSQPGQYYNFNYSNPIQADDYISGSLVARDLNTIKALVPMQTGLVTLADRQSWLLNGGTSGEAISPLNLIAKPQAYAGCSDVPPIVANDAILYVQAKGSIVRYLNYNFYNNVYTGTDISVLSSHLFYGHTILEWAFAEEPFKLVWAVRDDGELLVLTILKEQELIGWAHRDTDGLFKSVCTVVETVGIQTVDATYVVVQRTIGANTVQYIERMDDRFIDGTLENAWCVDSGLSYLGSATTTLTGADHLAGETVTGIYTSGGVTSVLSDTVVAADGSITVPSGTTFAIVGLPFTPQLQTLPLDLGEPTVQGKRKKIGDVTVRVQDTLGLEIGTDEDHTVPMKDLVVGNVGSQSNEVVTGLVTGDAMTIQDPKWDPFGQYFIQQTQPFPATILGVIPNVVVGDK